MGRIADQHDVPRRPPRVRHRREPPPHRAVADQRVTVELVGEQPRQKANGLLFAGRVHARAAPGLLRGLHDERRLPRSVVLVGVHTPQTVLVLAEVEGERRKRPRRAQPHETVGAQVDRRFERVRKPPPNRAVEPVRADHEVRIQVRRQVIDLRLEVQPHADVQAAFVQQQKQFPARKPGEPVPGRLQELALVVDVDVVPVVEAPLDRAEGRGVGLRHLLQRRIGEDDAEAEGVVGQVALEDVDLPCRVGLLEQEGGKQASRTATDDVDLQGRAPRPPHVAARLDAAVTVRPPARAHRRRSGAGSRSSPRRS